MTMQTNTLPFQVTGANPTAQRPATPDRLADTARGTGAFSATLNREMAARQPAAAPPQAAASQPKPAQGPKPAQAPKPAGTDKPTNSEPVRDGPTRSSIRPPMHDGDAKPTQTASSDSTDAASDAADAAAAAEAAAAAATTPVTDMLAFMASLTQPASTAATVSTDAAAAGAATQGDAQLTALETALDNLKAATTGAADATDDTSTGAGGKGQSPAGGVQQAPAELRTTQAPGAALPQGEQDVGQFQAQLRETQQQQQPLPVAEEAPAPLAALQAQAAKLDATGNPALPGDRIPARLGTQAWDNQVSQRIVYMVGKEQAATLTLNPPDLGPVQIVLNVTNDQATVAFSSDQLDVRQALENALPRLREMMSESGIALSNATVDANVHDGRQQQDTNRRAQGGQGGTGGLTGDGQDAAPAVNEVAPRTRTVSIGERGMVDLFA
ncbi:flagellar hook-length control protein FliK [Massilia sp. MP_M2]|uniref:flagellar hook-length control protein FliK n=1 Tax=Massilia sp. MP_M2 TaxID=3071713 RepID=UPI00319E7F11